MISKRLGKKFIVLGFLLVVLVGIFLWQNKDFGNGYLNWLKTGILNINPFDKMMGPELQLSEDSGLNLSDVDIESLMAEKSKPSEEKPSFAEATDGKEEIIEGIGGPIEGYLPIEELVIAKKQMTLEEIEQEVNRIAKEVERIEKDVQALVVLHELKRDE